MKTNVYAMFHLCKAAIPLMKPGAAIINTGSVNSVAPEVELLDYASTKGAILIFTKALAKQLGAKQGIRVNMVARGRSGRPCRLRAGNCPARCMNSGRTRRLACRTTRRTRRPIRCTLADGATAFTTGSAFGANGGTGAI